MSLLSRELFRREAERVHNNYVEMCRRDAEREEAMILAYLAEHPGVRLDQLRIRRWYDGRASQIEIIPPEELWLDWQSDNHGWGRQEEP